DERTGPAAHVDQVMPVEIVARQPRQLEAHDDADFATGDRGHDAAEAAARLGQSPTSTLILVDDGDALAVPAQRDRLLDEPVLKALALEVVADLAQRGLPNVDESHTLLMLGAYLESIGGGRRHGLHRLTPFFREVLCAARAMSCVQMATASVRQRSGSRFQSA